MRRILIVKDSATIRSLLASSLEDLERVCLDENSERHASNPLPIGSTEGFERDPEKGLGLGADAYLVKPFDSEVFRDVVADLLVRDREAR